MSRTDVLIRLVVMTGEDSGEESGDDDERREENDDEDGERLSVGSPVFDLPLNSVDRVESSYYYVRSTIVHLPLKQYWSNIPKRTLVLLKKMTQILRKSSLN